MTGKESAQGPVAGRRSACGTQETKATLARGKKSEAAGIRLSGAALAVCPRPHGHVLTRMPPTGKVARCGASVAPRHKRGCGSSASKPCSCPRRSVAHAATYSGAPMGVPRATNRRSGNGLWPRAPKCPAERRPRRDCRRTFCLGWRQQKALLRARRARAIGHGDDIQVIQESSEKLSRPELLGGLHQRRVLRKGKQDRPTTSTPTAAHRGHGQRVQAKASLPRVCQGRQPGTPSHKRNARQETRRWLRGRVRWQREAKRPGNP